MIYASHVIEENKKNIEIYKSYLKSITNSGTYLLGKKLINFEKTFANICKTKYAVGLKSGLDGLILSLKAIGINRGDHVITSSLSAYATVLAIYSVGATPVLADINLEDGQINIDSLKNLISKKTKAYIHVYLYGNMGNIIDIKKLCKINKIKIIEDCAQAHGARLDNRTFAGSLGEVASWSFYPTKNIGSIADAGAITTNTYKYKEFIYKARDYGQTSKYNHTLIGTNSRLDEFQSQIISKKLSNLEQITKKRIDNANYLHKNIINKNIKILKKEKIYLSHVYHQFVILSRRRNQLKEYLLNHDIQTNIHYPKVLYLQKASKNFILERKKYDAIKFTKECLSIPCHNYIKQKQLEKIVNVINEFK